MTSLARALVFLAAAALLSTPHLAIAGPIAIPVDLPPGATLMDNALILPLLGVEQDRASVAAAPGVAHETSTPSALSSERLRRLTHLDVSSVIQSVPEPATIALVASGLAAALGRRPRSSARPWRATYRRPRP